MPRVTVVIATYNWATVLPYSIGSVLDQTFTDFEVFVVGDGCTDESGDVVTAVDDPRVHWRNLPSNVGHQSGPNNAGIREANGDVIAYLVTTISGCPITSTCWWARSIAAPPSCTVRR